MNFKRITIKEGLLFLSFLLFSVLIMYKTIHSDSRGNMVLASKVWSDFAATIPLIRSFSLGSNFPPQYPLFAGPPIRYHFIFFLFVGLLERLGFTLPFALNLLSCISFTALLSFIYLIAAKIFKSKTVGILSVLLFLFNGSLAFLQFFSTLRGKSLLTAIITNQTFPSFGPYDGNIVSAFWNLNIYTNQRHLAFAYSLYLVVVYFLYRVYQNPAKLTYKKSLILALGIGVFPFVHLAVFGMLGITLGLFWFITKGARLKLCIAGVVALIIALPQILYMGQSSLSNDLLHIGYLSETGTLSSIVQYWMYNLGLILPLSIVGFVMSSKKQRIFFLPFITLFIVGNVFQFSPEISANHKFFNLFVIGANMFVAQAMIQVWQKNTVGKLFIGAIFPFLILSGVIDFFPILNDRTFTLIDGQNNHMETFIKSFTPPQATFINATFLYDSASLAGRNIYLGWPYFAWSAGYDTSTRHQHLSEMLSNGDLDYTCAELHKEGIEYVLIEEPTSLEEVIIDYRFFEKSFVRLYSDEANNVTLYDVVASCKRI